MREFISTGQDLAVQLEKLGSAGCPEALSGKAERSGRWQAGASGLPRLSAGGRLAARPQGRLARSTSDLYKIISQLQAKGVEFKVIDDPSIDTTSRTGKLVMGILALIAEFENDIRRERQTDGIRRAKEQGKKFGRKPVLTLPVVEAVRTLRADGTTVPEIMRRTNLSKASVYRALAI